MPRSDLVSSATTVSGPFCLPRPLIGISAGRTAVRLALAAAVVAGSVAAMTTAAAAATPSPVPGPSPSPGDVSIENPGGGFGISDWIAGWINSWFSNLVALAIEPMLKVLAVTLLTTPDVTGNARVFDLWKASTVIANSGFVLLATIGAIAAMGHETVQTRYAVKEVLPRLLLAVLATNTSFTLCGKIIELANVLSQALLGQNFDGRRALTTLRSMILPPAQDESFYILLALVAVILMALLLIAFVMRAALVLLLVVAAPLALACLALPYTDGLARFWWRAFTGLLIAQIAQSLTLVMAVRIFFNQDGRLLLGLVPSGQLINLVLAICLLIILVRIPRWMSRRIFAQTAGRGSSVMKIIKYAVAYRFASPVLSALHLTRGTRRRASTGVRAGQGIQGRVLPPRRPPGPSTPGGPGSSGTPRPPAGPAPRSGPGQRSHHPSHQRRSTLITQSSPTPPSHGTSMSGAPQPWWQPPRPFNTGPGQAPRGQHLSQPGRPPVPPAVFLPPVYPGSTTSSGRRTPPGAGGERR
ncbi:conjugal transfer protein TrbL family protein [Nonomuraea sp. NPDC003709]|uniref:conjugal transfer protein TrbL family protein n=1 Tax=Nonomuraea sp. NPDC003709 TaxID=3154450 RepID=UPI0033A7764E